MLERPKPRPVILVMLMLKIVWRTERVPLVMSTTQLSDAPQQLSNKHVSMVTDDEAHEIRTIDE